MIYRINLLTRFDRSFHACALAIRVAAVAMVLMVFSHSASATGTPGRAQSAVRPCKFSDAAFDVTTDVHVLDQYRDAIALLLKREKFSKLDCLANAARTGKTKFSGGSWKLRNIYVGLASPRPGHPTQVDWRQHMTLLKRWGLQNPHSITAPIALAESYVSYAWDARGDGFADSVSESGWKLFNGRLEEAKTILDSHAALARKCPDWYIAMQQVSQGQGWDLPKASALLQRATAFEPEYLSYYRIYAGHLVPNWGAEEDDAARFAEETANRVGGDAGDLLYFSIADSILCACQEPTFGHFSWPRLQKGFAASERTYGPSLHSVNSFALMASKSKDWVVADPLFKRIGENWDIDIWRTEDWFQQNRDEAAQFAPGQAESRGALKEAQDNLQGPGGEAYRKDVQQRLAPFEQSCLKETTGEKGKVDLFVQIGATGTPEAAHPEGRPTPFTMCIMRALYGSNANKENLFAPPPHAPYWVILELDPSTLAASTK